MGCIIQLEQAIEVSKEDVRDASAGVLKDLKRFQGEKEEDLKKYMVRYFAFVLFLFGLFFDCLFVLTLCVYVCSCRLQSAMWSGRVATSSIGRRLSAR